MVRDQNDDKRRALVMGKFKFLYQDETEDLEAGDKFQLAVVQNKLLGTFYFFQLVYSASSNVFAELYFI